MNCGSVERDDEFYTEQRLSTASCTTPRTSLAVARGHRHAIIPHGSRLNERGGFTPANRESSLADRARHLCEIARGRWASAIGVLREALADGCKYRWLEVSRKTQTPIVESERLLGKLRSCGFLAREEYQLLVRLIGKQHLVDVFEVEHYAKVVAKVVG